MNNQKNFPTRLQLWRGAILRSIAHAVFIANNDLLAYEVSWDGANYNLNNTQGCHGTITFGKDYVIGAFFDVHSSRSPFRGHKSYDLDSFFVGIPENLYSIAKGETLQYLLDDYQGLTIPIISTAFWSDAEHLTAAESWESVLLHGGFIVEPEIAHLSDALAEIKDNYGFSSSQIEFVRSLFTRKINDPQGIITLTDSDYAFATTDSRELLKAIGILYS